MLSIKCLDEGIDIPSITHALIIASDQNPRQFIQRRGRVLRKDPNNPNKTKAFLYDLTVAQNTRGIDSVKNLAVSELKRSLEFSKSAANKIASQAIIRDMAYVSKLDINEIDSAIIEEGIDVEEEDFVSMSDNLSKLLSANATKKDIPEDLVLNILEVFKSNTSTSNVEKKNKQKKVKQLVDDYLESKK